MNDIDIERKKEIRIGDRITFTRVMDCHESILFNEKPLFFKDFHAEIISEILPAGHYVTGKEDYKVRLYLIRNSTNEKLCPQEMFLYFSEVDWVYYNQFDISTVTLNLESDLDTLIA